MKKHKIARARSGKQKVLLVDDHPVVREGLAERINRERDLVVCGEAQNAREALRAVASLQPDIVILDLSLPKGHGLELVKDLRTLHPDLRVVVFSMHDESVFAERALRAGAHGYVMKQEPPERLLVAIRTVLRGDYLTHSVARLSDRELEIFQLIGQGVSTRKIADRLGRSIKTIETHRTRIKEKLAVKSAAELVHRATCWVESDRGALDAR
ncbi:MAG: DNA-binding response regulator [Verrucomicrobia bacterium]|nr:MAG: DNA-binding response regulator [Verrucomicrobiota bacterium]